MAQTQSESNAKYRLKHGLKRVSFDFPETDLKIIKKEGFTYAEIMRSGMDFMEINVDNGE